MALYFLFEFGNLLLGFVVDGATAALSFFFFLPLPILFFATFAFFTFALPNFALRVWMHDLGRMANLKLIDKQGKELVKLKPQVLV